MRIPARCPLALALMLVVSTGHAQTTTATVEHDDHTPVDLTRVQVKASPLAGTAEDLARPVEVLTGERLDAMKANSLGETVSRLAGVQSSYFGPGVGRPIIRGFDGARVQVLSDGLRSGDVSTVSADHAVTIEPFLANQIEVLKGPATLLYGSGAIGGAVNVVDGRIPEAMTDQPLQGRAELRAGTVNDERTGMVRLDGTSASGNLVFHVDALHRETGDYDIPGFAESTALLAEEGETPDPDSAGVLPNSALRTDSAAIGVSWIGDRGFVGIGQSLFNTRYGVPGHGHEEAAEDGGVAADESVQLVMDQRRTEIRGGLDNLGMFESLRVKLARTGYTHTEFEGAEVGTIFDNDSTDARLELVHQPWGGWNGAFGLQGSQRDFVAIGEEGFVPASESRDAGVFWIGERQFGPLKLELGARHDNNRVTVDEAEAIGPSRTFDTFSASAAAKWDMNEALHLSFGVDRAQRSPSAEELYSNGMHVATASIELGNPGLDVETANRAEIGLHWHSGPLQLNASVYHVQFDDFVYLADTGIGEELPVRVWTQDEARFNGAEVEVNWNFADNSTGIWDLRLFGDVVRAKLDGSGVRPLAFSVPREDGTSDDFQVDLALGGNLPRIAPSRLGGEVRWEKGAWRASAGAVRYAEQDDVAEFESPTAGYTLVDAHLAWHRDTPGGNAWEVFLDGSNLLDREARVHTSFLKDLSPLPGRGFAFGVRAFF